MVIRMMLVQNFWWHCRLICVVPKLSRTEFKKQIGTDIWMLSNWSVLVEKGRLATLVFSLHGSWTFILFIRRSWNFSVVRCSQGGSVGVYPGEQGFHIPKWKKPRFEYSWSFGKFQWKWGSARNRSCFLIIGIQFFNSGFFEKTIHNPAGNRKMGTSQNVYSAQTFIYVRYERIEHGKRVFFGMAQKLPELPADA